MFLKPCFHRASIRFVSHFSVFDIETLFWLCTNIIKQLSFLQENKKQTELREGDWEKKIIHCPLRCKRFLLRWECKHVGEAMRKRRRRRRRLINEERRKRNERTGEDGPLALIKVRIFTALSSLRLNTNNSQQLLSELANPHYHNVLHVYLFRGTELHFQAWFSPRGNESSTFNNSSRKSKNFITIVLSWLSGDKQDRLDI